MSTERFLSAYGPGEPMLPLKIETVGGPTVVIGAHMPRRYEYRVGGALAYIKAFNSARAVWGDNVQIVSAHKAERMVGDIEIAFVPCATRCDDDCDARCHEEHKVMAKRKHTPRSCGAAAGWTRFTDSPYAYRTVTLPSVEYPAPMLYVRPT